MGPSETELSVHWLEAVRRPEIARELEAIFLMIGDAVDARRPVCEASGRCCNFRNHGHLLYVTGLETAYMIDNLKEPLRRHAVDAAIERGDCPFLIGKLCGAHTIKPSGCRIYFCDPTAQDWQHELYERSARMLRDLHDRCQIEYRYGEWRTLLSMFAQE